MEDNDGKKYIFDDIYDNYTYYINFQLLDDDSDYDDAYLNDQYEENPNFEGIDIDSDAYTDLFYYI